MEPRTVMMQTINIDLLTLAIPKSGLASVKIAADLFTWGPVEGAPCYVKGCFIGQLTDTPFGRPISPLLGLTDSFQVIQLAPMLRSHEVCEPNQFLQVLEVLLTGSKEWALWCECDADQQPVQWFECTVTELTTRLSNLFCAIKTGTQRESPSFIAYHGLQLT
jgi:hypothetical protein